MLTDYRVCSSGSMLPLKTRLSGYETRKHFGTVTTEKSMGLQAARKGSLLEKANCTVHF